MKKGKYIISFILVLLIPQFSANAQENIKADIINFIKKYEKYSSFTKDGLSYEESYEKEFKGLFATNGNKELKAHQLFNDLDTVNSPPYIGKTVYLEKVKKHFPKGINISIDIVKIYDKTDSEVEVVIKKNLFALSESGRIYKNEFDLTFSITHKVKGNNELDFKIIKITAEGFAREPMGFYVGVNIQPSISSITTANFLNSNNNYGEWGEKGKMTFNGGIEANYYLTNYPNIGIGARLNYTIYKSSFDLSRFVQEPFHNQTDIDGDKFSLLAEGSTIKEDVKLSFIEIPVFAKLRYVLYDIKQLNHVFLNIGPVFSFGISNTVSTSGEYTYKGYYPEYHVVLYDIPEYGYYTDKMIVQDVESQTKSFILSGLIEAGVNIPIVGDKVNMNLSLIYQKGFVNISNSEDDNLLTGGYNKNHSILDARSKVKTGLFGVNIGILYHLF